ncbi:MAG: hypothetical protein ACK5K7_03175 [Bacilli bacterium]
MGTIYELDYKFIQFVANKGYCTEIMDKNINKGRPYFYIEIKVRSKTYLIPFRSSVGDDGVYKIPGHDGGLDFKKSIPLTNKRIIKRVSNTTPPEYGKFLMNAYNDICSKFTQYIPTHNKHRFSTNHKGLIEAQNKFK